jgi:hypothetical protein
VILLTALSDCSAATEQMDEQKNDSEHQEQMDAAARHVKSSPGEEPRHHDNEK